MFKSKQAPRNLFTLPTKNVSHERMVDIIPASVPYPTK